MDCTGHGVPGAFMSIVGNNGLNKAVNELKLTKPSFILDALNLHVTNSLHIKSSEVKDGMDIALCLYDPSTRQLEFSGANNPLYIIRAKNESNDLGEEDRLEVIKGDKQAVGAARDLFTNHLIQLQKGDIVYLFTDGYADQFGGEKGKKFSYKRFKDLLLRNSELDMRTQREQLNSAFEAWSADEEQVDDICVIGVKI